MNFNSDSRDNSDRAYRKLYSEDEGSQSEGGRDNYGMVAFDTARKLR
jgi:hypothetical protein